MPLVSSGLYKVTLEQEYLNQLCLNTFYFQSTLNLDDVQDLCADAFNETLMPFIADALSLSVLFENIRAENVTGTLADVNLTPTVTQGVVIGLVTSSFVAATIRLDRTTKETRNGSKRFTGMVEENINGQRFENPFIAILDNLAVGLAAQISTVGAIFDPVIARAPVSPETDWTINNVASAQASEDVSSQVSRKKGKGI